MSDEVCVSPEEVSKWTFNRDCFANFGKVKNEHSCILGDTLFLAEILIETDTTLMFIR